MECPFCHQEHPIDSQFCPKTGQKFCQNCGQPADSAWTNCSRCGRSFKAQISKTPTKNPLRLFWPVLAVSIIGLLCMAVVGFAIFWNWTNQPKVVSPNPAEPTSLSMPPDPVTTSQPAPEKEVPGVIAFESARDGNLEIYVINTDGSGETRLTDNPASDSDPSWSGDGQKIAFSSNRNGNWEIYSMNADGSQQTRLTNNQADDAYPAWSPDGKKIAFTSNRDGNLEIYFINADGSQPTRITNDPGSDSFPDWSGDGKNIVFQFLNEREYSEYQILTLTSMGSSRTSLSSSGLGSSGGLYPSWSPDGKMIAYVSKRDLAWGIDVVNADGSNPIRLTKKSQRSFSPEDYMENGFPAWSGDGKKLAFVSGRDGNSEIYSMNADGSQPTRLTINDAYDGFPDWAPSASGNAATSATTIASETEQTPIEIDKVDPNLACALHGIFQPSDTISMFDEPSFFTLSCLDQDGWHIYDADKNQAPPQTPSWLTHLPARPWADGLAPLHFPAMTAICPGGRIYLISGTTQYNQKLYMLEGNEMVELGADGYPSPAFITCGKENEIWLRYEYSEFISRFDGNSWTHYPSSESYGSGAVKSIAVAPNGNFWVASMDSIATFDGSKWLVFDTGKVIEEYSYIELITVDPLGNVWAVNIHGNENRLLKYDGAKWSIYAFAPEGFIKDVLFDKGNRVWVATDHSNIYIFDPQTNRWILQFGAEALSGHFRDMQFDRQGRLWVITDYGLNVFAGSKWVAYQMHTANLFANTADSLLIFGNGPTLPALVPKTPGSIQGRLINPDPKTFAKKRVELCLGSAGTSVGPNRKFYGETPCATLAFHVITSVDANGNFEFSGVPLGIYHIMLEISSSSWASMADLNVIPGTKTELGEIAYPPASR